MMLNKNLQEINIQNMDVELVAQMFKNYQSNVLFHLEGELFAKSVHATCLNQPFKSYKQSQGPFLRKSLLLAACGDGSYLGRPR
jgi:hypothetical protein